MSDTHTAIVPESRTPLIRYAVLALLVLWIVAGVVVGVGYARYKYTEAKEKAEVEQKAATKYAATHPPTPVAATRIPGPCERPWSFDTREIPEEGLPVYLCQGWEDFAFGGAITIVTPGGRKLHDTPGADNHWGFQPNGIYTFHADPAGSKRSVRIYNRW